MKLKSCLLCCLLCIAGLAGFCQEDCSNGKDDDGDGLVDLKDPDCQCRITVRGNLFQNGSFEDFLHCPTYLYDNDNAIARFWRMGTYTNGSEAIYYHNLACSSDSAIVMKYIPPALPLPDGKAFVSIRQAVYRKPDSRETDIAKTYVSQCLQTPLKKDEDYVFSFSAGRFRSNDDAGFKYRTEPFTVALFGHLDCNAVPFGGIAANSNGCPANYAGWVLLGKTVMRSTGNWVQGRVKFTAPFGVNVVAIGPDCSFLVPELELADSTTRADFYVYYLDDVHLLPAARFPSSVVQTLGGNVCQPDSVLRAPSFPNAVYQWYRDSIAIAGATQQPYRVPKNISGFFSVRVSTADTCFVTDPYYAGADPFAHLHLANDTTVCKDEPLVIAPASDNITYLWDNLSLTEVKIDRGGVYEIKAIGVNGCSKTFTIRVGEQACDESTLHMPNAFTPNGDGRNDVFRIPATRQFQLREFSVFDRWGKNLFSTRNLGAGWNGTAGGRQSPPGTYVYLVRGRFHNKPVEVKGTVSLIR
ncbi:gliding motility-associated C-terminal domain-containing protein [Flavisolibacter nicotianae]|uniref:gliding motility-associated C-terminal domain-containing protein n=1 Tax=Flavisolibacter nicotianae TaxID=2364882 RepID=UPI000EB31CC4|nr:gliding motility-associated C-terminal domain-containing protein [Flavisolibacter nicotianae]